MVKMMMIAMKSVMHHCWPLTSFSNVDDPGGSCLESTWRRREKAPPDGASSSLREYD